MNEIIDDWRVFVKLTEAQCEELNLCTAFEEIILMQIGTINEPHDAFYFNADQYFPTSIYKCPYTTEEQFNFLKEELKTFKTIHFNKHYINVFIEDNAQQVSELYSEYTKRILDELDHIAKNQYGLIYNKNQNTIKIIDKEKFTLFLLEKSDYIKSIEPVFK